MFNLQLFGGIILLLLDLVLGVSEIKRPKKTWWKLLVLLLIFLVGVLLCYNSYLLNQQRSINTVANNVNSESCVFVGVKSTGASTPLAAYGSRINFKTENGQSFISGVIADEDGVTIASLKNNIIVINPTKANEVDINYDEGATELIDKKSRNVIFQMAYNGSCFITRGVFRSTSGSAVFYDDHLINLPPWEDPWNYSPELKEKLFKYPSWLWPGVRNN